MFSFGKASGPSPSIFTLLNAFIGFIVDEHWAIRVNI